MKFWMDNNYKRTEFFRTEFIDEFDARFQVRFNNFDDIGSKFYDQLEIGRVYAIDSFEVVNANKVYNALPSNYEASFHSSTKITELLDDGCYPANGCTLLTLFFRSHKLEIFLKLLNQSVLGIILNFTTKRLETNWKTKEKYLAMDVELTDKSGYSIRIKLTEQYAERFNCARFDVY